jgi:HSP20 family molecular chaperone IbpA
MKSKKNLHPKTEPVTTLMQLCEPEALRWDMQQIQLGIARRAYELFETRNREHGHDWEDWFQAESELLRPVSIAVSEAADRFSIRANVLGFQASELKVSIEPRRIVIFGGKQISGEGEIPPVDFYPDLILRVIDVSSEIDPAHAAVELQSGILKFELPKVAKSGEKAVAAGRPRVFAAGEIISTSQSQQTI